MTPKDKLTEALKALDDARRVLERLDAIDTADSEIDDAISSAAELIESEIAMAADFQMQCV